MFAALIPALGSLIGAVIDKAIPDADLAANLKAKIVEMLHQEGLALLDGQIKIILAEATGESWLQRNWRPLIMITFTILIGARWLGWSAPGITPDLETQLFEIVKIGLSGYVIGRSAEKIAESIAPAVAARRS